jgi:hypothetical protein
MCQTIIMLHETCFCAYSKHVKVFSNSLPLAIEYRTIISLKFHLNQTKNKKRI